MLKRLYLILTCLTFTLLGFSKEYKVYGPQGGLAMEVTLPDDFNEDTGKCPMVILMHGIFSSKNIVPIPAMAKAYTGPVRLIHGSKDSIVPMSCSEKFVETYTQTI